MPTHDQLLDAEIAFILYNGQVYTSHPTDRDVSLTKLVKQVETLNHLPPEITMGIDGFLRGGEVPHGLELVGRYNMTNGRMAPYGPVNSAQNQETVRQAIQSVLYNASESPQEPSSALPNPMDDYCPSCGGKADVGKNGKSYCPECDMWFPSLEPITSKWVEGREFMPLVDKVDHGECPFCHQKRSLYHMKSGYHAQAMGIYGHGLCRDCLTTRMDEHESMNGKLSRKVSRRGFRLVAADIDALAQKAWERVFTQQVAPVMKSTSEVDEKIKGMDEGDRYRFFNTEEGALYRKQLHRNRWIMELFNRLLKQAPETYKLFSWVVSRWKKGRGQDDIMHSDHGHVVDILTQATNHLSRLRDDPRPTIQVPDVNQFKSFRDLESWVYEENRNYVDEDAQQEEKTVFEWPDGWTIKQLGAGALGREGDLMGHCVGGYCTEVDRGDTHIYSLRDPKNQPHVTFEVEGQWHYQHQGEGKPEDFQQEGDDAYGDNWPAVYSPESAPEQIYRQVRREPLTPAPKGDEFMAVTYPHQGHPGNKWPSWKIVQIQGKQDTEPIDEYKKRINEFFTHLQQNEGVEMEWGDDQYDYGDEQTVDDAQSLDEWYTKLSPGEEKDQYGLPKKDESPYVRDWTEVLESTLAATIHDYDRSRWRGNWHELAQALYALIVMDTKLPSGTPQYSPDKVKAEVSKDIEKMQETLDEWSQLDRDHSWQYYQPEYEEKFAELLQKHHSIDPQEEAMTTGEVPDLDKLKEEHEDLWYEAQDVVHQEYEEYEYGDAYKMINYIYWLNESGHLDPNGQLPKGTMPDYDSIAPKPEAETDLPGALSAWTPAA